MGRVAQGLFVLCLVSLAAGAGGCGGGGHAVDPLAPQVYLDQALMTIRADTVYAQGVDWPAVTAEAHKMAARATTPSGTYPAIRYAIRALRGAGDLHANFFTAPQWKQFIRDMSPDAAPTPGPTVTLVRGRLGSIALPEISTRPATPNSRRYERTALTRIAALQAKEHPCGWIVDLRTNTGGDMVPMLLAVGPILGEGRLIGFTGKNGLRSYVSYRNGALSQEGTVFRAPLAVADVTPAPPVAVLTHLLTASAAEVVTVAFRGRPQTRSFGKPTMGATTAPLVHRLADGAYIRVGHEYYVDRKGAVYRGPVTPDVTLPFTGAWRVVEKAAQNWLLATPACSRTH